MNLEPCTQTEKESFILMEKQVTMNAICAPSEDVVARMIEDELGLMLELARRKMIVVSSEMKV